MTDFDHLRLKNFPVDRCRDISIEIQKEPVDPFQTQPGPEKAGKQPAMQQKLGKSLHG